MQTRKVNILLHEDRTGPGIRFFCEAVDRGGGWRIIKTLGVRLTKLEPQHGFAAETAAATAIELASRFGIPLSTTHTISTAIIGVGAVQRRQAVRWSVARSIVYAWILTFPVCALIAYTMTKISMLFFK